VEQFPAGPERGLRRLNAYTPLVNTSPRAFLKSRTQMARRDAEKPAPRTEDERVLEDADLLQ